MSLTHSETIYCYHERDPITKLISLSRVIYKSGTDYQEAVDSKRCILCRTAIAVTEEVAYKNYAQCDECKKKYLACTRVLPVLG